MNRFPRMVGAATAGLPTQGEDGDSRPGIVQCGKVHHSTPFGGQCEDDNTGQHVYDREDNLFSINRRK